MNNIYNLLHGSLFLLSLALFSVLSLAPVRSFAVDFHLGINAGEAQIDNDRDFYEGSIYNISVDNETWVLSVYSEIKFNRFIRLELGILDGGLAKVEAQSGTTFLPGVIFYWGGPVEIEYGLAAAKVGGTFSIPLTHADSVRLLLKGGIAGWASIATLSDRCCDREDTDEGISPYYGVGLEFDLSNKISVRLQHERFTANVESEYYWYWDGYELEYQNTTAGLLFRF